MVLSCNIWRGKIWVVEGLLPARRIGQRRGATRAPRRVLREGSGNAALFFSEKTWWRGDAMIVGVDITRNDQRERNCCHRNLFWIAVDMAENMRYNNR